MNVGRVKSTVRINAKLTSLFQFVCTGNFVRMGKQANVH